MKLSLIIPAYNEEKRIGRVIDSYAAFLDHNYNYEIIIICDGTDSTARLARSMMSDNPRIKMLEFSQRQGKGGAIIQGFRESGGEVVGFLDADESIQPEEFQKLIDALNNADCAIASRRVKGAHIAVNQPWERRISSRMFNILVNLLFSLGIRDTQCGAKVFKKEVLTPLISSFKTRGFEFDVELLWRIKNAGFTVKEIPVTWKHENGSSFSLMHSSTMFLSLLRVRLSL